LTFSLINLSSSLSSSSPFSPFSTLLPVSWLSVLFCLSLDSSDPFSFLLSPSNSSNESSLSPLLEYY